MPAVTIPPPVAEMRAADAVAGIARTAAARARRYPNARRVMGSSTKKHQMKFTFEAYGRVRARAIASDRTRQPRPCGVVKSIGGPRGTIWVGFTVRWLV